MSALFAPNAHVSPRLPLMHLLKIIEFARLCICKQLDPTSQKHGRSLQTRDSPWSQKQMLTIAGHVFGHLVCPTRHNFDFKNSQGKMGIPEANNRVLALQQQTNGTRVAHQRHCIEHTHQKQATRQDTHYLGTNIHRAIGLAMTMCPRLRTAETSLDSLIFFDLFVNTSKDISPRDGARTWTSALARKSPEIEHGLYSRRRTMYHASALHLRLGSTEGCNGWH